MQYSGSSFRCGVAAVASVVLGVALASCAAVPEGSGARVATSGAAAAPSSPSESFYTGRLRVVVNDQDGRPLERANVEVVSGRETFFRALGQTDRDGSVTFSGVPPEVNVSVVAQNASFSQNFSVSPSGLTEMSMILQTFEVPEEPSAEPAGGGQAPGGFGF